MPAHPIDLRRVQQAKHVPVQPRMGTQQTTWPAPPHRWAEGERPVRTTAASAGRPQKEQAAANNGETRRVVDPLERLQRNLEAAPVAQCLWFGPSRRLFTNRRLRALFALKSDGPLPRGLRRMMWEAMGLVITQSLEERRSLRRMIPLGRPDKHAGELLFHLTCRPVTARDGSALGVLCSLRSTSTRFTGVVAPARRRSHKVAGSMLKGSAEQACALMPMAAWWVAADFSEVLYANALASAIDGTELPLATPFAARVAEPDRAQWLKGSARAASQTPWSCEIRLGTHAASARWHRLDARFQPGAAKGAAAWLITAFDIHALREREARAEATCCVRKNFLTVASHELRTPVTSLQLNLQLAAQRLAGCDANTTAQRGLKAALTRSLNETQRLEEVIGDVLDASRVKAGKIQLQRRRTALKEVIDETLVLFSPSFAQTGSHVAVDVGEDVAGEWDHARLAQLFFNLFSNILKHAAGSSTFIRAHHSRESEVRIDVSDNGPGIASQFHRSVFLPFERATKIRGVSGLGLGLYLSNQILREHGGSMGLCEHHETGAHFIMRLPKDGGTTHKGAQNAFSSPSPGRRRQRASKSVPS